MLLERAEVLTLSNQLLASPSIIILDSEMELHRTLAVLGITLPVNEPPN
jgi:hypothetical protein